MVRVTSTMLSSNYLKNVNKNLSYMQTMQSQLSTGKEISKPSDDPYKASRIVQMYADVSDNKQYNENISDVTNLLDVTNTSLTQMTNLLSRVRELMVTAGNAAYGSDQLQSIQDEMKVKVDQLSQILNTSFDGKYIFGGTKVDSKPTTVVDGKLQYADESGNAMVLYKDKDGNFTLDAEGANKEVALTATDGTETVKDVLNTELDTLNKKDTLTSEEEARKKELQDMIGGTSKVYVTSDGKYTSESTGKNKTVSVSEISEADKTSIDAQIKAIPKNDDGTAKNPDDAAKLKVLNAAHKQYVEYNQIKSDMSVEISQGVSINYNQSASDLLEFTDTEGNTVNLSDLFSDIINNLGSDGDRSKIAGDNLRDLDKIISNVLTKTSEVGAMQNRMESAKSQNEDENYNLTSILSSIEDIDFTEKMIDFSTLMTVYQASLQISSKILPQTIMDYL